MTTPQRITFTNADYGRTVQCEGVLVRTVGRYQIVQFRSSEDSPCQYALVADGEARGVNRSLSAATRGLNRLLKYEQEQPT